MAFIFQIKRVGSDPTSGALASGELGYNTSTKRLFVGNGAASASAVAMDGHTHTKSQITDFPTIPTTASQVGAEPTITAGTTAQYYRGDKSWQTFPTIPTTASQVGAEPTITAGTTAQYYRGDKSWQTFPTIPTTASQVGALSTSGGTVSGDITLSPAGTAQVDQKAIKWKPINSKTPYFGYALDQTDGTFVWSINGTNYASGLAIGGGSGNLLYKGGVVLTANNVSNYVSTSLSLAASGTRGGIQIGYGQNGKNYPVQLSSEKAYVNVPWENTTYGYATSTTAGLVKISVSGSTLNIITQ